MISEQEARSAAEVVRSATDHEETEWRDHNWSILAQYAIQELARREAERAERSKPIDAEWLESVGFYSTTDSGDIFECQDVAGHFYIDSFGVVAWSQEVYEIGEFTTRGQLLDLLAALKGTEP